jgi:addiction module HigA family antidote
MSRYKPIHPSSVLKDELDEMGLSTAEIAKKLDISEYTLNKLLSGQARITFTLASKLSEVFNTSGDLWINMQQDYDRWMWEALETKATGVETKLVSVIVFVEYDKYHESGKEYTESAVAVYKKNRKAGKAKDKLTEALPKGSKSFYYIHIVPLY